MGRDDGRGVNVWHKMQVAADYEVHDLILVSRLERCGRCVRSSYMTFVCET